MIHDPPSKIAEDFMRQVARGCIYAIPNEGSPMDQTLGEVREYLKRKHLIALDRDRINFALSCIETGLANIERGRCELGARGVREGVEFIRNKVAEASRGRD